VTVPQSETAKQPGLRERKKERTRQLIADAARALFAERGFEAVTVADVARAADVAEKTVFNYFRTKEDLFYSRLEEFEQELLEAVRAREPDESILAAVRRYLLQTRGVFALRDPAGDEEATKRVRTMSRVISESPALLARERRVFDDYANSLTALIAEETGSRADDLRPRAAANALLGVHRALIGYARERALAGAPASRVARELRNQANRAFDQLERGLGDYGVKR
jgi:AcrR family transcriptional regulator